MAYQDQVNTALGLPADASADQAISAITEQLNIAKAESYGEGETAGSNTERARVSDILEAAAGKPYADKTARTAIAKGLAADTATAMIDCLDAPPPAADTGAAANALAQANAERDAFRSAWTADAGQQAPNADSATGQPDAQDPEAAHKAAWESNADLRREFSNDFDRYTAFQSAQASGRIKILKR